MKEKRYYTINFSSRNNKVRKKKEKCVGICIFPEKNLDL